MDDLVERDGLYYKKFSDIPFTGEIKSKTDFGQMVDGKKEGPWVDYHVNGLLVSKGAYKNGKREGPWVYYDDDGTLRKYSSGIFKDDVKISD